MEINYLAMIGAAFIPMLVGAIWYGPLFGKAWQATVGLSDEEIASGNMPLIMGLSLLFSLMLSFVMSGFAIHQMTAYNLFVTQPEFADKSSEMYLFAQQMVDKYGDLHRTFGHGAAHGVFAGLFIAFPIIAIKALFERRTWKYIFINAGYWILTLVLMCGVLCQFV